MTAFKGLGATENPLFVPAADVISEESFCNMLNNHQKRHLKTLAHARKPVVMIGSKGLTEAVLAEIEQALTHHELIKIKVNAADRSTRDDLIENISTNCSAELLQRIGHVATFYRRNSDEPRIQLT